MINNIGIRKSMSNIKAVVIIKNSPVREGDFWSFIRIGFDGLHFFHCDYVADDILKGVDLVPMNGGKKTVGISGVDVI